MIIYIKYVKPALTRWPTQSNFMNLAEVLACAKRGCDSSNTYSSKQNFKISAPFDFYHKTQ